MKHIRHIIIATVVLTVIGSGCKKDDPPHIDLGYAYFPTALNKWIDYQVDTIWIHYTLDTQGLVTGQTGDTDTYPLREELVEDFTDPAGRAAQRMIRYTKDSADHWLPHDVWWQSLDNVRAERTEENERRIKLTFAPHTNTFWNTNAFNVEPELELTFDEVDVPWSVNGMSFDSTVLVTTTYQNNFVKTITYKERYAKHVGLVYREVDSTITQTGYRNEWRYKEVITGYAH